MFRGQSIIQVTSIEGIKVTKLSSDYILQLDNGVQRNEIFMQKMLVEYLYGLR